ncbi:MAG TPA: hypothetical protein VG347_01465 [Verrucomicrobiae bacterium]|nr:hypothetical protein [Verrucomicrobiae bacterium]
MDSDERDVVNYLQTWGASFVNAKEVARRASTKKRFGEEPDWAKPVLVRLTEKGVLEADLSGRYRMKPEKHDKAHRWVSPDINQILKEGGVAPDGVGTIHIEDEDV